MNEYIVIGADFVPTERNYHFFSENGMTTLIDERTQALLDNAAFRIFNLETPLTDNNTPIDKCGPNLIAPTKTIDGYKRLKVDLLTIGNNHILDQGDEGFFSTLNTLDNANIKYVGGGKNLKEASKPYIFEFAKKRIGIYACVEHEFSMATNESCGANPYDPLESFDHVHSLKEQCDYMVVLYHGGKEHYRYPSPELQKVCRKFVEKGADLIVCQHSHCIGCEEKYLDGTIVYGQGNFLFDYNDSEYWKTSLLICINDSFKISYFPIIKDGMGIKAAEKEECNSILEGFRIRSEEILSSEFIERNYQTFADEMISKYCMYYGARISLPFRIINRITNGHFYKFIFNSKYKSKELRLAIYDFTACESHRELFLKGILK